MNDHRGDFKLATYNLKGGSLSPTNDFLLATIRQDACYRFKEVFCGVTGVDWNGSGPMEARLRCYRGQIFGNNFNQVSGVGLKVADIPISLGRSSVNVSINPYNRALHNTNGEYPLGSFFTLGDVSGGVSSVCASFDFEIECDFMVLSVSTAGNLWGGGPTALLAVRGFTHPPYIYQENNFEYNR